MANIADYLPGGASDPEGGINDEIKDAQGQQEARQDDATPAVDWEQRYSELEKLNSRQAQTLGDYRRTIDDFIVNPTPTNVAADQTEEPATFSLDDFYDHPDEAIRKVVESHPAIQDARNIKANYEQDRKQAELNQFAEKHPDYADIGKSPEFQNWIMESPTRQDLFRRGDQYDFSAADALFSLYKAENGLTQVKAQQDIQQAELVSSSGELAPAEVPQYSRSEYINNFKRAKQGDLNAEEWVKTHAAGYRMALQAGNVRD
jgi:hypothetical protein